MPVIGRANAAAASQNFLKQLAGIKHHLLNAWAFEDVVVSQASVTYTRKDGSITDDRGRVDLEGEGHADRRMPHLRRYFPAVRALTRQRYEPRP